MQPARLPIIGYEESRFSTGVDTQGCTTAIRTGKSSVQPPCSFRWNSTDRSAFFIVRVDHRPSPNVDPSAGVTLQSVVYTVPRWDRCSLSVIFVVNVNHRTLLYCVSYCQSPYLLIQRKGGGLHPPYQYSGNQALGGVQIESSEKAFFREI